MKTVRRRRPTFRQIEAFRHVLTTGSMKNAAIAMSISQPAVSKIIRSLEDDLSLRLFLRGRGGLRPSEAALALHERTERLFVGLEEIAEFADRVREQRAGRLRIAAMSAMALSFLPVVVGQFLQRHPGVSVVLDSHGSGEVVRHVRARRYDLGLAMPPVDFEGVDVRRTIFARCVCILPRGHRLGSRRQLTPEAVAGEPFVSLAEGSLTRLRIDEAFASRNVARESLIAARSPETVASFVRGGQGLAVIDPFTAARHREQGGLVKPFVPVIPSAISTVMPPGAEATDLLRAFVALLDRAVAPYVLATPA